MLEQLYHLILGFFLKFTREEQNIWLI